MIREVKYERLDWGPAKTYDAHYPLPLLFSIRHEGGYRVKCFDIKLGTKHEPDHHFECDSEEEVEEIYKILIETESTKETSKLLKRRTQLEAL